MQMFGQMPGMMGVYGLLYLVAVVAVVIALWRGMRAQETVCSACHALPDPRQHTQDEWPAVVDRMTQNMRSLDRVVPSDSELKQVITFLQSNAPTGG